MKGYEIIKELGRGGMATVYLAQDKKFDTEVAIKFLNKEFINNENIRKRFIAEAKNMYKMSHPNIIKVTDLIDEGDTVAFIMEHIDGETLKEYLDRKGKRSDEEIRNIFSQMLDAVGYVHTKGLVHRDLKPSNFMIDCEAKVKLLDFGIAKNTDSTQKDYTHTGTGAPAMGTLRYMSPEQITETKSVTEQSDIYSLGVVLWQLVMGKRPYNFEISDFHLQTKIVNESLEATGSIFDKVIQKATDKEVSKRYKNCEEFLSALFISSPQEIDKTVFINIENNEFEDKTEIQEKKNIENDILQKNNDSVNKLNNEKLNKFSLLYEIGRFLGRFILGGLLSVFTRKK
jgi:serine/threonine protein kinase